MTFQRHYLFERRNSRVLAMELRLFFSLCHRYDFYLLILQCLYSRKVFFRKYTIIKSASILGQPVWTICSMQCNKCKILFCPPWWRHQMETFSALLAIDKGNSPVSGEFPAQRPVTRSFNVVFDLRLNKQCPLWRHCNVTTAIPYNAPVGELREVYCEYFGDTWRRTLIGHVARASIVETTTDLTARQDTMSGGY